MVYSRWQTVTAPWENKSDALRFQQSRRSLRAMTANPGQSLLPMIMAFAVYSEMSGLDGIHELASEFM